VIRRKAVEVAASALAINLLSVEAGLPDDLDAKAIGPTIPETFLPRADEVIE
jgi:hypothetical protein